MKLTCHSFTKVFSVLMRHCSVHSRGLNWGLLWMCLPPAYRCHSRRVAVPVATTVVQLYLKSEFRKSHGVVLRRKTVLKWVIQWWNEEWVRNICIKRCSFTWVIGRKVFRGVFPQAERCSLCGQFRAPVPLRCSLRAGAGAAALVGGWVAAPGPCARLSHSSSHTLRAPSPRRAQSWPRTWARLFSFPMDFGCVKLLLPPNTHL